MNPEKFIILKGKCDFFVLFTDTEKSGVMTELLTNIITSNTNGNDCKQTKRKKKNSTEKILWKKIKRVL